MVIKLYILREYMEIERLGGGGSDYAAFVQHIGIASADVSFGKGNKQLLFFLFFSFLF